MFDLIDVDVFDSIGAGVFDLICAGVIELILFHHNITCSINLKCVVE